MCAYVPANMTGANLRRAQVANASFRDVRFIDADLSELEGSELADFDGACASLSTILPDSLNLPLCDVTTTVASN